MMRGFTRYAVLFAAWCWAAPSFAATNCESIKNDLAYNECLAKSAPPAAARVKGNSGANDPEASVRERGAQNDRGVKISRQSNRVSAVIDPWAGVRTAKGERKKRR